MHWPRCVKSARSIAGSGTRLVFAVDKTFLLIVLYFFDSNSLGHIVFVLFYFANNITEIKVSVALSLTVPSIS